MASAPPAEKVRNCREYLTLERESHRANYAFSMFENLLTANTVSVLSLFNRLEKSCVHTQKLSEIGAGYQKIIMNTIEVPAHWNQSSLKLLLPT